MVAKPKGYFNYQLVRSIIVYVLMHSKVTSLSFADRWLRDGLQECGHAGCFEAVEVDARQGAAILQQLRADGCHVTWTHIFVRSVALVLAKHPELHQLVAGNSRLRPATVDICLSVNGESSVTPVLVVEDAANKDLRATAAEIIRRTPDAVQEADKMLALLRRFGWLVPFAGWRRALIGMLLHRIWYRRKASGTFQISCLPHVDWFAPLLFNTAGALGVGRVRDKVVAVNGQPAVHPMVTLFCSADHSVWNGMAAAKFLTALREIVESGAFLDSEASEVPVYPSNVPALCK